MSTKQRYTFRKEERLKSRKLIEDLFKTGTSFACFPLRIIYLHPTNSLPCPQAAFSVSSKSFKKAVERNRIKRLMRESYRLQRNAVFQDLGEPQKNVVVFFIFTGKSLPQYQQVYQKMGMALHRLHQVLAG
jgi:ribonuclease P protein component